VSTVTVSASAARGADNGGVLVRRRALEQLQGCRQCGGRGRERDRLEHAGGAARASSPPPAAATLAAPLCAHGTRRTCRSSGTLPVPPDAWRRGLCGVYRDAMWWTC
jgi:hypothetical protein